MKIKKKLKRFNLLDFLAYRWINFQYDRDMKAFEKTPEFEEMKVKSLDYKNGKIEMILSHSGITDLAAGFAEILIESGAENYYSFVMYPRYESGILPVEVTIRRFPGGLTPAVKAGKLADENKRLLARIAELEELSESQRSQIRSANHLLPIALNLLVEAFGKFSLGTEFAKEGIAAAAEEIRAYFKKYYSGGGSDERSDRESFRQL